MLLAILSIGVGIINDDECIINYACQLNLLPQQKVFFDIICISNP